MIHSSHSEGGTGNVQEREENGRRHVLSNADLPGIQCDWGVRRLLCAPPDDAMLLSMAYLHALARELSESFRFFFYRKP